MFNPLLEKPLVRSHIRLFSDTFSVLLLTQYVHESVIRTTDSIPQGGHNGLLKSSCGICKMQARWLCIFSINYDMLYILSLCKFLHI